MSSIKRPLAIILCTAGLLAAAYTVDPPTTAPGDTIQDCTAWDVAQSTDTCNSIADYGFITLDQLYAYVSQIIIISSLCMLLILLHRIHLLPLAVVPS